MVLLRESTGQPPDYCLELRSGTVSTSAVPEPLGT